MAKRKYKRLHYEDRQIIEATATGSYRRAGKPAMAYKVF